MKRKFKKMQLGFGRKDDNLRIIFNSQTRQTTIRELERRTNRLTDSFLKIWEKTNPRPKIEA